jgi:hypothetical protein
MVSFGWGLLVSEKLGGRLRFILMVAADVMVISSLELMGLTALCSLLRVPQNGGLLGPSPFP